MIEAKNFHDQARMALKKTLTKFRGPCVRNVETRASWKKGAVLKIFFPINIGVNGASECYSGRSEADNSKTVNPTEKADTL